MVTRTRVWVLVALAGCSFGCGPSGTEGAASADSSAIAALGLATEAPSSADALALRVEGHQGLRRALDLYDAADRSEDPQGWENFVDEVGGARDTSKARLFWETDLARAKAEAERRRLPILSLRMLGDLRDELSCANSRFFRTTLYADPEVSGVLRENFVLHWSSERDVPVVEITFGDGRSIKTTTTGNSIHYLLDAERMVLDAAPGLYTPGGFKRVLEEMRTLAQQVGEQGAEGGDLVRAHHGRAQAQAQVELARWWKDYAMSAEPALLSNSLDRFVLGPKPRLASASVGALDAQRTTASKAMIEAPTLRALGVRETPPPPNERNLDRMLAELTGTGTLTVSLSEPTLALIRRDRPRRPGESESDHEARILAMMRRFQSSIITDELKNEYDLRLSLHGWLADDQTDRSLEVFNERVYRELFLTPASDPWLGLVDNETYDGLVEAGVTRIPG
ncbi:MAG: hypothetical protein ACRBN8_18775 [Nannocystales bacterium]